MVKTEGKGKKLTLGDRIKRKNDAIEYVLRYFERPVTSGITSKQAETALREALK